MSSYVFFVIERPHSSFMHLTLYINNFLMLKCNDIPSFHWSAGSRKMLSVIVIHKNMSANLPFTHACQECRVLREYTMIRRKPSYVFFTLKHHTLRGLPGEQACYNGWACFPPGLRNWAGDSKLASEIWTLKLPCSCPDEGGLDALTAERYCSLHKKREPCVTPDSTFIIQIYLRKKTCFYNIKHVYLTSQALDTFAHLYTPTGGELGAV